MKCISLRFVVSTWVSGYLLAVCGAGAAQFDSMLDAVADRLTFASNTGDSQLQVGGSIDLFAHRLDSDLPFGWYFVDGGKQWITDYRLTITGDLWLGDRSYVFTKIRVDGGIHPGLQSVLARSQRRLRVDELFIRHTVAGSVLSIQVGRYVPMLGGYLGKHDPVDNPFVNDPLVYDTVTSVSDVAIPADVAAFAARAGQFDNRLTWLPIIWAPYYAQGVSLIFEKPTWGAYLSFVNRSPTSRSGEWNDFEWGRPTWIGRLRYQPSAAVVLGISASHGSYLADAAAAALPHGVSLKDPNDYLLGVDGSWEGAFLKVSGEIWASRIQVVNVGNADSLASHLQLEWKVHRAAYIAVRANFLAHSRIATPSAAVRWDNDTARFDLVGGWRPARHALVKLQYSRLHHDAPFQNGRHLVSISSTIHW
jgi:hypothetical protein